MGTYKIETRKAAVAVAASRIRQLLTLIEEDDILHQILSSAQQTFACAESQWPETCRLSPDADGPLYSGRSTIPGETGQVTPGPSIATRRARQRLQ